MLLAKYARMSFRRRSVHVFRLSSMLASAVLAALVVALAACPGNSSHRPFDAGIAADGSSVKPDGTPPGDVGPSPTPDAGTPTEPTAAEKALFDQLVTFATQTMQQGKAPGAAVGVLLPGRTPLLRGIGIKRVGGSAAVTPDTLFSLASISKLFTASTALVLEQQGTLSLGDTVVKHLPALKTQNATLAAQITLHQLLNHTSGLGYEDAAAFNQAPVDWNSADYHKQLFERYAWPIWAPPGAVYNYSNRGFSLAGVVLEQASGKRFGELVRNTLQKPAGMTSSCASATCVSASADHADGHDASGKTILAGQDISFSFDDPTNGVYASARELLRFAQHLLGAPGPLTASSRAAMSSIQAPFGHCWSGDGYGYGLFVRPLDQGVVILEHGGTNRGFTASLYLVPQRGFAVVVLMSSADAYPSKVSAQALDLFLPDLPYPTGGVTPLTAAEAAKLAGSYQDPYALGPITLMANGSALTATFGTWGHSATLKQVDKRVFSASVSAKMQSDLDAWSELYFNVEVDSSGKGAYLVSLYGVAARSGP
jgi:CubicO group peptidase (beta-lactamase class C family)